MDKVTHPAIVGIDVSRDWLDIHRLPDGQRLRLPNTSDGHARLVDLAHTIAALVCFEATGGQEWRLWAALDAAGVETRQLPPAQIKAFAPSRGTRAKTDRIDAELIARFMSFRPDAGRALPHEKLGTADMVADMDGDLRALLDRQVTELEARTERRIARDSGRLRGRRAIGGGRRALRHILFQAALVACHHNPALKTFADRLRKAGKPHKVVIIAVARKLVTIVNALCKTRKSWDGQAG